MENETVTLPRYVVQRLMDEIVRQNALYKTEQEKNAVLEKRISDMGWQRDAARDFEHEAIDRGWR